MAVVLTLCSCADDKSARERVRQMIGAGLAMEDSNAVMALDLYEEAFDLLKHQADSSLEREIHLRKGLLFLRHGLSEESIGEMHQAFVIDSLRSDSLNMQYTARYMAFAYESVGQISMAHQTISQVAQFPASAPQGISAKINHDYFSRYKGCEELLESLPDEQLKEIPQLTPNSSEIGFVCNAWQIEQQGDDLLAVAWYEKLLDKCSPYVRAFAVLRIVKLQLRLNHRDMALHYIDVFQQIQSEIRLKEQTTKQLLQHAAKYQDRRAQAEITRLTDVKDSSQHLLALSLAVGALVIAMLLLMIRTYRQRQTILRFKVGKLRQMREAWLAKSEQERQLLIDQRSQGRASQLLLKRLNDREHPVISGDEWSELEHVVLEQSPDFQAKLHGLCRISTHDYHVCLLIRLGMKPCDIARLTARSDEAISSTRRRLYARSFGKKGTPAEWDEIIGML